MATPQPRPADLAEHLFTQAIALPATHRLAFLRSTSSASDSLVEEVLSMLRQFERLSGFLDAPLRLSPPEPLFRAGDEAARRFRIERFIARGGMGEVYAARDRILDEQVALKTIGAFQGRDQWLLDRFRDEIRLGRLVSHRNVCRVHDVHEHSLGDGRVLLFFAMELLDGETLAAKLAREGPLPVSAARAILKQILSGLAEAHARGVVHLDLKPANVMLTPDRAVITDFGLAQLRFESAEPDPAAPSFLAGSLPYMAPEQLMGLSAGRPADVFALGVVTFEMLTGQAPFPSGSLAAALEARLADGYRPAPKWRSLIARCLAPKPDKRPHDLAAIAKEIRGGIGRRTMIAGAAASAAGIAYAGWRATAGVEIPEGVPVLLVESIEEPSHRGVPVLDQLLRTQLNQSAHFEILGRDRIAQALARMNKPSAVLSADRRAAREVALREGAPLLIAASLRRGRETFLHVDIERLGSHPYLPLGASSRGFPVESDPGLRTAAADAARWIRQSVGEHSRDLARRDRRPEEATTSSWESLIEYAEAESARASGDDAEAVRRLRQALALDDEFPLAHMRLAEFLLGLGHTDEGFTHWMRAAQLIEERRLTDRESFRIRALFLHDMADYSAAATVIGQWSAEYPNDYLPSFYLASCQRQMGRPAEALELLDRAGTKAPGNVHVALNRAQLYMEQGDLIRAREQLERAREMNSWWWQYMAEFCFVSGDYTGAWKCFERMDKLAPEWRSRSFGLKACLLLECGQVRSAIRLLQAGIEFDRGMSTLSGAVPRKLLLLGRVMLRTGDAKAAAAFAKEALTPSGGSREQLRAAALLADAGERKTARNIAQAAFSITSFPVFRAFFLRYEAAMDESPARAAQLLGEAQRLYPQGCFFASRAALLDRAGFTAQAAALRAEIVRYPARYWLEPDRVELAIFRDAADTPVLKRLNAAGEQLAASSGHA